MLIRPPPAAPGRPAPRPGAPSTSPRASRVPPVTRAAAEALAAGLAGSISGARARARTRWRAAAAPQRSPRAVILWAGTPPGIEPGPLSGRARAAGTVPQCVRAPTLKPGPGISSGTACLHARSTRARTTRWEAQMGGGAAHLHDVAVGAGVEQYEEVLVLPVRAARPKYRAALGCPAHVLEQRRAGSWRCRRDARRYSKWGRRAPLGCWCDVPTKSGGPTTTTAEDRPYNTPPWTLPRSGVVRV